MYRFNPFSLFFVKTIHEIISFDKLGLSNNYKLLPPGRVKFVPEKILSLLFNPIRGQGKQSADL